MELDLIVCLMIRDTFLIDLPNKTVEGRVGCRSLDKSPIFS